MFGEVSAVNMVKELDFDIVVSSKLTHGITFISGYITLKKVCTPISPQSWSK